MDGFAKSPERFAAGELAAAFQFPALRIMPELDWLGSVAEVHHASWIQDFGIRQRQAKMPEQA